MVCDHCGSPNTELGVTIISESEKIAGYSVMFLQRMIHMVDVDSREDKWNLLKERTAKLATVATAILGSHVEIALDDSKYLIGEGQPEK
ncbi:MAG: hypothetical protein ABSG74_10600 [Candidatus Bathyarchaeia archaeon]|jgi:hypothetical protein